MCSLSHPCLTLRESACFAFVGWEDLSTKAFMEWFEYVGKVEVVDFSDFPVFVFIVRFLIITFVTIWSVLGGCD